MIDVLPDALYAVIPQLPELGFRVLTTLGDGETRT